MGILNDICSGSGVSALAVAALLSSSPARAEITVKTLNKPVSNEERDRLVDQAALDAQGEAIAKLRSILARYKGTIQEPLLLGRLAESYQQQAAIHFRVAHGRAHRSGKKVELSAFKKSINLSITTLDDLIQRFPRFENMEEAWFLRGKAFEEIEDKANARKNYLHLVRTYPDSLQAPAAYMSLAQFSIDENKHAEAISFLENVEKRPTDPQYPYALYKLAWSHYNLKNIPAALAYLERHIDWYSKRIKAAQGPPETSDVAIRDNSIVEVALFYIEGIEQKHPDYSSERALPYFRKIDKGPVLGRVASRFAKLLRAHTKEAELSALKDLMLKEEIDRSETVEVVMTWFEDRVNKRKYMELVPIAADIERIVKANPSRVRAWESYSKAVEMLVKTAEEMQGIAIKNKNATEIGSFSESLAGLYMSITRILDAKDPRIPGVHFNLAETLFEIKNFEGATEHYRWVVENWRDSSSFDLENTSLRALSSRYEVLRASSLVTDKLEARALTSRDSSRVDPKLEQWVSWIDAHRSRFPAPRRARFKVESEWLEAQKRHEAFENFEFEANRALYSQGQVSRAVARLLDFAYRSPDSRFAIPSAALALDSYILTGDWKKTHELSRRLGLQKAWSPTEFGARVFKVEADAWFKILEGSMATADRGRDLDGALYAARECLDRYKSSERFPDCLLMAAKIEIRLNRESRAEAFLTQLLTELPDTEAARAGYFERGRIHERNFRFAKALDDYEVFVTKGGETAEAASRLIPLAWLSGQNERLRGLLARRELCQGRESLKEVCDRMEAFLVFRDPSYKASEPELRSGVSILQGLRKKPESNRALWALVALAHDRNLGFADRIQLFQALSASWNHMEPALQLQLLSPMIETVKSSLAQSRRILVTSYPLKAEKRALSRRVDRIKELESETVRLVQMPWARLRTEVLAELAAAYTDMGDGLRALPAPTGLAADETEEYKRTLESLSLPFDEKAVELRSKAFEIASELSIDDAAFSALAESYVRDNPSKAPMIEAFRKPATASRPVAPSTASLRERFVRLLPDALWTHFDARSFEALRWSEPGDRARLLFWSWMQAYETEQAPLMAFLLAEAKKSKALDEIPLGVLTFLTLERIGARAEALAALEAVRAKGEPEARGAFGYELALAYFQTGSKERAVRVLNDLSRDVKQKKNVYGRLSRDEKKFLAAVDMWARGTVSNGSSVQSAQARVQVTEAARAQ